MSTLQSTITVHFMAGHPTRTHWDIHSSDPQEQEQMKEGIVQLSHFLYCCSLTLAQLFHEVRIQNPTAAEDVMDIFVRDLRRAPILQNTSNENQVTNKK